MISEVLRWMLRYRLFRRTEALDRPRDVILWWEARRIPFNAIVGAAGFLAGLVIFGNAFLTERLTGIAVGLPDPPLAGILVVIVYGILANICFTGGWIAELIARRVWEDRAEAFGEVAFALGTAFSVLLTLIPAAILICAGASTIFRHRELKPDQIAVDNAIVQCPMAKGTLGASFPSGLPPPILSDFRSHVTAIADVGKPFNATDMLRAGLPSRRLILVRHSGPRWVIAYEHGGLAYHDHIVGYEMTTESEAKFAFNVLAYPGDLCERSAAWLLGGPVSTTAERWDNDW